MSKPKSSRSPIKILIEARDLIANGWTQDVFARDKTGSAVYPLSRIACQFCLHGAICRAAYSGFGHRGAELALEANIPDEYNGEIVDFNDFKDTTQAKVLAVLDATIKNLKAQ